MSDIKRHEPNITDYKALHRLQRILDILISTNHKMPLSSARAFVEVAMNPGKGPTAYGRAMGVEQPTMSRLLLDLGPKPRYGEHRPKLVDRTSSPKDIRETEYYLTFEGYRLMRDLIDLMS